MNKIYFFLLLLLCISCSPNLEKALKVVTASETNAKVGQQEIHKAYPKVTAEFSATTYPVKEKTTVVRDTVRTTVTIPGKKIPCPGVTGTDGKVTHSYVQCPDCVYEQTTIRELETRIQENTALAEARQKKIEELEVKYGMSLAEINKERNEKEVLKAKHAQVTFNFWVAAIGAVLLFLALVAKLFRLW